MLNTFKGQFSLKTGLLKTKKRGGKIKYVVVYTRGNCGDTSYGNLRKEKLQEVQLL
jgi:hypothetical protein